jgi:hypothetical protein
MMTRSAKASLLVLALVAATAVIPAVLVTMDVLPTPNNVRLRNLVVCRKHLMQIAMAVNTYHHVYHSFPPAYTVDRDGKPLHSWRVLLLPFIGETDLYASCALSEPWNSRKNSDLARFVPETYRCPADGGAGEGWTSYVAVVGPHAAWREDKILKESDIADSIARTLMLVEVADSGINWMEPRDLAFGDALAGVTPNGKQAAKLGISSHHASVVNCVFGNGSIHCLVREIDPAMLRALLTADGGEDVSDFSRWEDEFSRASGDL